MKKRDYLKVLNQRIGNHSDLESGWDKEGVIALLDVVREPYDFKDELLFEWEDDAIWHYALGMFHGLRIGWDEE